MRLVIIESPYAGAVETNVAYARAAVRDSLLRGEAPSRAIFSIPSPAFFATTLRPSASTALTRGWLGGASPRRRSSMPTSASRAEWSMASPPPRRLGFPSNIGRSARLARLAFHARQAPRRPWRALRASRY